MDIFLETYSPQKLSQEEIHNLNRLIIRSEIESVILKFPAKKVQDKWLHLGKSTKYTEKLYWSLNSFKRLKRREHAQSYSMKPPSSW